MTTHHPTFRVKGLASNRCGDHDLSHTGKQLLGVGRDLPGDPRDRGCAGEVSGLDFLWWPLSHGLEGGAQPTLSVS